MKKLLTIVAIVLLALLGFYFFKSSNSDNLKMPSTFMGGEEVGISEDGEESDEVKKASFAIFTNGTFRVFTAERYHNLSEDVYITPASSNMVFVEKVGVTWGDFFETLPMDVTRECLTTGTGQVFCTGEGGNLKFFLNGQRDNNLLDREIEDGDKILITFGNESEEEIQNQLEQVPEPNQLRFSPYF